MPILRGNTDTNTYAQTGRTVKRLSVVVRVQHSAIALPKLKNVTFKGVLNREGKDITIFNDNLDVLARESMFFHAYDFFMDPTTAAGMAIIGGDVVQQWPLMIDLKSPINLTAGDKLTVEASLIDGWYGPGVTNTNGCYIDFGWRDDIGVETFIPIINSKAVQAGVDKVEESLGDNVISIAWINLDIPPIVALAIDDTTSIIKQFGLQSDKYRVNDTQDRMIGRRHTQFELEWTGDLRWNSFVYIPDGTLNKVLLDCITTPANVTTGQNTIVWRTYGIHGGTMKRAAMLHQKHDANNRAHIAAHIHHHGQNAHS